MKTLTAALLVLIGTGFVASAQQQHCLILDVPDKPIISASLNYSAEADVIAEGYSNLPETDLTELDLQWEFGYFRDVWGGNVDLDAVLNARVFSDKTTLRMPDQLVNIALDAGWTRRYQNNLGCQIRLRPGIYSDFEEFSGKGLFVPLRLMGVYTLSSDASLVLGADVRAGFERVVMPVAGLTWAPSETLRIDARIPAARLAWYFERDWIFELGWLWRSDSYRIRENTPYDRDMFTIEEQRMFAGITRWINDFCSLSLQIGQVYDREMEFTEEAPFLPRISEIDDAFFVSVTVGGPFL